MIELDDLTVCAGAFALRNVSLLIPQGTYAVLMGGTGQGKTSLLEVICGLKPAAGGQVRLEGRDVTSWKPADRGVGYVPQDLALFPTISVRGHLEFALKLRRWSRAAIRERVAKLADLLGIAPLLERGVRHLSGGEAQRVAIGLCTVVRTPSAAARRTPERARRADPRPALCIPPLDSCGNRSDHAAHHPQPDRSSAGGRSALPARRRPAPGPPPANSATRRSRLLRAGTEPAREGPE